MAHTEYRPPRKRKKSWLGRIIFWSAAILVVLITATVIAMPWILRAGVPEVFAQFGVQATVGGGGLSLLRREITFENLVVGAPDAPALSLGELGVGLGLRALVAGRIKLRHIRVKNVSIDTERLLALRKLGESGSASSGQPLAVEFDEVALEDVRLDSLAERLGYDVRIDRLVVSDLSALLADKSSKVALQGTIGGGDIDLRLALALEKQSVRATGKFQIDKVPARGWARLAPGQSDPVSGGAVNGRGDIQVGYGFETERLDLTLDGRVAVAGLGLDVEPVKTERGDAHWQGRLALQWSPDMAMPTLRGDGSLEVTSLHLGLTADSQPLLQASVSDLSWHGDFNWRDGFSSDGAILGTSLQVSDDSSAPPGWQTRAEDFSWRLHAQVENDSGAFAVRIQDFDLARVAVKVAAGAPVDIAADKVAVDEIRAAQSGDLVLGQATMDALVISVASGANAADAAKVRLSRLAASGLSGDLSGKLHAAQLRAESVDYSQSGPSGRRVRAEEVDFASVGFRVPAWVGSDELTVKSIRADAGQGDIWLSGLKASKIHGDVDGRFGAAAVDVTHLFQSGSSTLSWDVTELNVRGIKGNAADTTELSEVSLNTVKLGIDDSSWDGSGFHGKDVSLSLHGDVTLARFALAKLEGRQPSAGELRVAALAARGLSVRDGRAALDGIKAATLDYQLHAGEHFQVHALEARELGGDASRGLAIRRFTVAGGNARLSNGAHLDAALLDSHELSVSKDGGVAIERAALQRLSQTGADKSRLHVDGVRIAATHWAPGAGLSTAKASLHGARFTRAGGVGWTLAALDTRKLDWDGSAGIRAEMATLADVSQLRGKAQEWRAQRLRAADVHLTLPAHVEVQTLAVDAVQGGNGAPAWKVTSLYASDLVSSEEHGQKVQKLISGAVAVTDNGNGALLDVERIEIATARVSTLRELSAGQLVVNGLQMRSDKPHWPGRLTLAQLQITQPRLHFDGAVDLGAVVATNPYLIIGRERDNAWIWPPVPGAGAAGKPAAKGHSKAGVRVASFVTRGPGRMVYIDRGTEPVSHLTLDPLVMAIENVNTLLPGNVMHFRAQGTGAAFAAVDVKGEVTRRVKGHDLGVRITVKGAYIPSFNPYIARHESLAVGAGRGDAAVNAAIENDELSGKADILLSGLEISSTAGGKVFQLIDPANFPIRTALALLKNRQGEISLSIPLKSRTASPNFDPVDAFQADLVRTLTTAGQVAANLPGKTLDRSVNLLENTLSLLPGLGAERYAAVEFAYGADDFSARSLVYLDQLGERMSEHESLVLALCGRAVPGDGDAVSPPSTAIDKLFAEARKGVYPGFAADRAGLLALAGARAEAVRRYLRDVHKVPRQRLTACKTMIDDANGAKPRVDVQVKTPAERKGLFGIFP